MTTASPGTFIRTLRERRLRVSLTKAGKLRIEPRRLLTAEDRAYIRDHAPRITTTLRALEAVDRQRERDEQERDAQLRAQFAAMERRRDEERTLQRAVWLVSLDEARFAALVDEGRISPEDVALRARLKDEAERAIARDLAVAELMSSIADVLGTRVRYQDMEFWPSSRR